MTILPTALRRTLGMAGAALLLSIPAAAPALAQSAEKAASLRESSCRTCHGETGDSRSETVPRLNGQNAAYLRARLQSLRSLIRESPRAIHAMGVPAAELSAPVIAALANFYAAQTPPAAELGTNKLGAAIYEKGAKDIPACRGCHGNAGEGGAQAPRLAGQHRAYLHIQLLSFSNAARIADPMNHHVWMMTPVQAEAVAAYLGK